jgi:hypothetical protein
LFGRIAIPHILRREWRQSYPISSPIALVRSELIGVQLSSLTGVRFSFLHCCPGKCIRESFDGRAIRLDLCDTDHWSVFLYEHDSLSFGYG